MSDRPEGGPTTLAGWSYPFGWVSGLLVLLLATRRGDVYARWHATQAILFGGLAQVVIPLVGLWVLMPVLDATPAADPAPTGLLAAFAALGVVFVATLLLLGHHAYTGRTVRIPGLAPVADRLAGRPPQAMA